MRRIAFHLAVPGIFALIAITLLGGTRGLAEPSADAPAHRGAAQTANSPAVSSPDHLFQPAEFIGDSVKRTLTQSQSSVGPRQASPLQDEFVVEPRGLVHARIEMMEVTAYCPCKKCCGPNAAGITASGQLVSHNSGHFVAADRAFPFHTKIIIPGYANNQAVPVLDRGGAIKGNKLDVFFPTHEQALKWGRKRIAVTIVQ